MTTGGLRFYCLLREYNYFPPHRLRFTSTSWTSVKKLSGKPSSFNGCTTDFRNAPRMTVGKQLYSRSKFSNKLSSPPSQTKQGALWVCSRWLLLFLLLPWLSCIMRRNALSRVLCTIKWHALDSTSVHDEILSKQQKRIGKRNAFARSMSRMMSRGWGLLLLLVYL